MTPMCKPVMFSRLKNYIKNVKMFFIGNIGPLDPDQVAFKRRALRDAVICIGWLKLISVTCYIVLYFLVRANAKDHMAQVLQIMILAVIPFIILNGVLLFLGALEEKLCALEVALWLCLIVAAYDTVLGGMGCVYFIRTGHYTVHFLLAIIFGTFALSLISVVCHDILIISAYLNFLRTPSVGE